MKMEDKPTVPQKFMARILKQVDKNVEKVYFGIKKKLFSQIGKGSKVLEIGPGTGVNFKYYPRGLRLTVVEPNHLLHEPLRNNARLNNIKLKIIKSTSEILPFTDNSIDFVVSTLVLCSVKDLKKSLSEIRRVLKKRGKYLFIEHVVDKKNIFRKIVQNLVVFPYGFFGDGCHPNRDILLAVNGAGFRDLVVEKYYQERLGFLGWVIKSHIIGEAVK